MKIYAITTRDHQFEMWRAALRNGDELARLDAQSLDKVLGLISPHTIVLIDMVGSKEALIRSMREHAQNAASLYIAALGNIPNIGECLELLTLGIKGYGHNMMAPELFSEMLDRLERGQMWFDPLILEDIARLALHSSDQPQKLETLEMLTPREQEVAYEVAQGRSNKEIAAKLGLSAETVKLHVHHIYEKLGIESRIALALKLKV
ncbi:MAG: response regulator transcription factor [Campylobacterales bacterium]|nr:response regulator transcription factor [Campylobacterales bacterium]